MFEILKPQTPRFSVVIPVYNHHHFLRAAVFSCLTQTLIDEILLIDDGSCDSSQEVMASFAGMPRIRIIESDGRNIGADARLNQLCLAAKNEWISVLNSDDAFIAHRFQSLAQIIKESGAEFIAGHLIITDDDGAFRGLKRGMEDPEYPAPPILNDLKSNDTGLFWQLLNQNVVATTSNMVFTRALFERVGGFRPYRYVHDWDFALRACLEGSSILAPTFLTKYRLHRNNTINESKIRVDAEALRLFVSLTRDYPGAVQGQMAREALGGNQHLSIDARKFFLEDRRPLRYPAKEQTTAKSRAHEKHTTLAGLERRAALALEVHAQFNPNLNPSLEAGFPPPNTSAALNRLALYVPSNRPFGAELHISKLGSADLTYLLPLPDHRPAVLLLSGLFAVGGVERNTIEIIRNLQEHFRFLLITCEPHDQQRGSLHHQLDDMDVPCVDLAHLLNCTQFFDALQNISGAFTPAVIWIINGSTWISENSSAIRILLSNSIIIDQQIYDVTEGWIKEINRPGALSSDDYIAINRIIYENLIKYHRIPENRAQIIYPCLSLCRVVAVDDKRKRRSQYETKFNISPGKFNVGFIGRLTTQKRPDRFLDLAEAFMARAPQLNFVLIGRGPLCDQISERIASSRLTNVNLVSGFDDISDVGAFLDGLVITSDYEGLPIALLECMAMEIPFISTDVGDVASVQREFGGGEICHSDDLISALEPWLARREYYRNDLKQNHNRLISAFSAANLAENYRSLFLKRLA